MASVLSGEGRDVTCAHAASSCSIRAHMLRVAMCRAGGVTMLGRHATETIAAHSIMSTRNRGRDAQKWEVFDKKIVPASGSIDR